MTIEKMSTYTWEEVNMVKRLTECFCKITNSFVVREEDEQRVRALAAIAGMIERIECPPAMLKIEEPEQPKKLTAAVFRRFDCPAWARFAGVDREGNAAWLSHRPIWNGGGFYFPDSNGDLKIRNIPGIWDAADWENSLIERI